MKVAVGPNKIMNMKNFKFCFYFCLQYALSLTVPFYVFELSLLKMIPEVLFMGFYSAKHNCFFMISKQNGCPFSIVRLSLYFHF